MSIWTKGFPRMIIISVFSISGCITGVAFFPFTQDVEIIVTDAVTGQPVANTEAIAVWVRSTEDCPSENEFATLVTLGVTQGQGITDNDGRAVLPFDATGHCSLLQVQLRFNCNPRQDQVTGRSYCVNIKTDLRSEILRVELRTGEKITGALFIIEVVSIAEPVEAPDLFE